MNHSNSPSRLSIVAVFGMLITFAVTSPLFGQDVGVGQDWANGAQLSLPVDWSFNHVVYTANLKSDHTAEQAAKMKNDPRLLHSWLLRGHLPTTNSASLASPASQASLANSKARNHKPSKPHRDWSLTLGSGGVAQNMYPANFNAGSPLTAANCTSDFVVFGLNVVATATQANLVGVDNLYSGASPTGLCGGAPTVKWAYKVATLTNGKVTTSPVLSLDGTQVAFVESNGSASVLHVLKWLDANGTVGAPVTPTPVTHTGGCTVPCMVNLTYDSSHGTTLSSPFYDYQGDDALYVGNDNGQLFRIIGVFFGTPVVSAANGWSATGVPVAAAAVKMTGPILDFNSGNVFVGGSDGKLYSVLSTNAATRSNIPVGSGNASGGGIVDAPVVDGSSGTVMAYAAANAASVGGTSLAANTSAVTVQANTTTPFGSPQVATIGQGTQGTTTNLNTHTGAFDNSYFSWSGSGANTGHFYMIGTAAGTTAPTLYQLPFSGVASIAVNTPGAGYTTPVVSFSGGGGGSGATATASGGVDNFTIGTNSGTFNTTNNSSGATVPTVTVSGTGGATATSTYTLTNVTLGNSGGFFCSSGNKTIGGGTSGTADTITVTTSLGFVTGVTFKGNGRVYNIANPPTLPGFCVTDPNLNWNLKLNTIAVNAAGSGYTGAPSVTFSSPSPTGTVNVTATINITNVTVTYGGGGYSPATTVNITGGTTNATATATINPGSVMTPGTSPTTAVVSATAAVEASPITEIFTNASTDLLFYGYGLAGSVGDIASQNVTNGSVSAATSVAEPKANGGTSGIAVDNISTQAQASSIYFGTLATSTTQCGATAAYCAVKLTQSGLQ